MESSVDTVRLNLQDYQVDRDAKYVLFPGIYDNETGEHRQAILYTGDGWNIEGTKATVNTDRYSFTLNSFGAFVSCSVPKVFHGHNDLPVNGDQVKHVIDFLQTDLKEHGVRTNLNNARLSRLDLVKQDHFRHPFPDYSPVLRLLKGRRQERREFDTSFRYQNSQRQLNVYDKGAERQNNEGLKVITPTNLIRAEIRYLFNRPVMKATGLETVTDLVRGYGDLTPVYNTDIKKYFNVRIDPNQEQRQYYLFSGDVEKELQYLKQLHGGRLGMKEVKNYIVAKSVYCLMEGMDLPVLIETVLRVTDYSNKRVLKARIERYFKELLFTYKALPGQLKDLYDELYLKFAV